MSTKGPYDFTTRQELYAGYSDAQLQFALKDARESRDYMRGFDVTAENWYADDVHTLLAEILKRRERSAA